MGASTSLSQAVNEVFDSCGLADAIPGSVIEGGQCGLAVEGRDVSDAGPRKNIARQQAAEAAASWLVPAGLLCLEAGNAPGSSEEKVGPSAAAYEWNESCTGRCERVPSDTITSGDFPEHVAFGNRAGAVVMPARLPRTPPPHKRSVAGSPADNTSTGNSCCSRTTGSKNSNRNSNRNKVPTCQSMDTMMEELFRLHDLNKDGVLEEIELIKLNEKIAMLHHGKDCDRAAVKAKFSQLFRERLDPDGRPVPYSKFRDYMFQTLHDIDSDIDAQELIMEQYIEEARSGNMVFHCKSFESLTDAPFRMGIGKEELMALAPMYLTVTDNPTPPPAAVAPPPVSAPPPPRTRSDTFS